MAPADGALVGSALQRAELAQERHAAAARARSGGVIGQRPGGDSGSKDSGSDEDEPEALASK